MSATPDTDDQKRLKRLRFRAWHRGMREVDLVLGPFADDLLGKLDAAELDDFEALLSVPDSDLYDWFIGRTAPPDRFNGSLIERIRAHTLRPTS
ncbi:MAG: succinate dehydrogenase assembly factor 2 [Alphaproteobacteria bacterium]|nr:succinate dehydrogenase assembly factor 2 [Alphaproteobacteria bacterium]